MKNTLNEFMGTDLEKQNRANDSKGNTSARAYACGSILGKYTLDWIGLLLFGLIYIVLGSLILAMDIQARQFFKEQDDLGDRSLCLKTFGKDSNYVAFIKDDKVVVNPRSLVDVLLTLNIFYMFWSVMYCTTSFASIFATCNEKEHIIRHFKNNNRVGHYGGGGDDEEDDMDGGSHGHHQPAHNPPSTKRDRKPSFHHYLNGKGISGRQYYEAEKAGTEGLTRVPIDPNQ
jgi:hypothetical protein